MKTYFKIFIFLLAIVTVIGSVFWLIPSKPQQIHAQTASDTWPQVQKDANRSGYVPQTVSSPYTVLWRVRYKVSSRVQAVVGPNHVYLPANDNAVYALNRNNGSVAWKFTTEAPNVNSAGYENNTVFFGSTDKHIYAVNAGDGTLKWRYKTGSTIKTAPLLAEGKVFFGGSDGYFYAINQNTGQLIWRTLIGSPIYDTAAYDNGKVFFGGLDSKGYALNSTSGQVLWSKTIPGQGFRDRWTVAGNNTVFFTPMLSVHYHQALYNGTILFHQGANPEIYNQPWATQRQTILNFLAQHPQEQPIHVLDQLAGNNKFVPPILYASGGSQSPHSQVVLLPNGNADVIFRRTFSQPAQWGATTNDALATGQLNLQTGDITSYDQCDAWGSTSCSLSSPFTSDESSTLVRSGNILYLDIARGTLGINTQTMTRLPTLASNNPFSGNVFGSGTVMFNDYNQAGGGWRIFYNDIYAEASSDGNDLKRPTAIAGDTFYYLHYGELVAVRGTLQ